VDVNTAHITEEENMSDFEGQYNSPEAPIIPEKSQITGNLTEIMVQYLKESSPWLRFMGIIGFIGFGALCLVAVSSIFVGIIGGANILGDAGILGGAAIGIFTFIAYGLMALLVFFPAYFTYNFGSKIRKYMYSNSSDDLEMAFRNNKSLWIFNGVLTIIYLAFMSLFLVLMLLGGGIALMTMFIN
jgi:hypothetical protein